MSIVCSSSNLNNIDKGNPTNYQLVFPKIPSETTIGANNPFVMNIHTAMLPSVSIATEELRWQGNKTKSGLIPMEFDPWIVMFTVDSRLLNWKLLFNWMSYINNNNDKIAEYHSQYSVDCSLVVTDNYKNSILEVMFVSIWPSQLQEVSFSQREGDVQLESSVTFNYDYFYIRDTTTWPIEFSSSSRSASSISESSSSKSSSSSSSSSSSKSSLSSSSSSSSTSISSSSSSSSSSRSSSSSSSSSSNSLSSSSSSSSSSRSSSSSSYSSSSESSSSSSSSLSSSTAPCNIGESWTSYPTSAGDTMIDIAYGNNTYVLLPETRGGYIETSTDGINWTQYSMASTFDGQSICFAPSGSGGVFIAVSRHGSAVPYRAQWSDDNGQTWNNSNLGGTHYLNGVCYSPSLNRVVAVNNYSNRKFSVYSDDYGKTWSLSGQNSDYQNDVCWGTPSAGGMFISVGNSKVYSSTDGSTWTLRDSTVAIGCVCWSDELEMFVGGGNNGNTAYSSDGINWSSGDTLADHIYSVVNCSGRIVGVGNGIACYTDNGINWTTTTPASPGNPWRGLAYNGSDKVIAAGDGYVMISECFPSSSSSSSSSSMSVAS